MPGSIIFEDEEADRINRAQIALLLHKFPSEVDREPTRDMTDVLAIDKANKKIEAARRRKQKN